MDKVRGTDGPSSDARQNGMERRNVLNVGKQQLEIRRKEQEKQYREQGVGGNSNVRRINGGEQASTSSGESNHASDASVNEVETPTATNGSRDGQNPPHVESSPTSKAKESSSDGNADAHRVPGVKDTTSGSGDGRHPPHIENPNVADGSGDGQTLTPSTDQPKPPVPEKDLHWLVEQPAHKEGERFIEKRQRDAKEVLEWLLAIKLGEELKEQGLEKHLGFHGITKITLEKITAGNLCVYEKGGTYYITTKDKEYKYIGEEYKPQNMQNDAKQIISGLLSNFDKIQWDLPEIHAIRTVELYDTGLKRKGDQENIRAPKALITDNKDVVQKWVVDPLKMGSKMKIWKGALPWASSVFEISSKNLTKEEKLVEKEKRLIYKALHGEISDRTKNKKMYTDNKELLDIIDENMMKKEDSSNKTYRNIIKEYEKNFIVLYYDSDSYTKKVLEEKFSKYGACIQDIKKKF